MVRKLIQVPLVRSFGVLIADRSIQLLSQLFNVFVVFSSARIFNRCPATVLYIISSGREDF